MRHLKLTFLSLLAFFATFNLAAATPDALFAVGAFNNWNINECVQFEKNGDVFTLSIDFTGGDNIKISSVDTKDLGTDNGWIAFDEGSINPVKDPELNKRVSFTDGVKNILAPARKQLTVIVDYSTGKMVFTDGGEITDDENEPAPPTPYSGTLPVLFINTNGGAPIESKETYVKGTYWLDPMGADDVQAIGSEEAPLALQIKGRGNYTWTGFDKKPYRLKLTEKAALLGMKKSKHFALLAHADDTFGFLRNPVGFWLSEQLGLEWTPAHRPVEVMLNGNYIGLYFLTETIRVDKDRVNVVEQADNATDPLDVTGGWLVEIDNYDSDPHITIDENGYPAYFTYKTPEVLSAEQESYLYDEMGRLNSLIYGDKNSGELWKHLDMDQLARYYIVQEIVDDYESFHGSCYLHKEIGNDEAWRFGPVWDFGSAFFRDKSEYIYEGLVWHQVWIGEICRFPAFMSRVQEIWKEFESTKLNGVYTYVDNFANKIKEACVADYTRWPQYGNPDETVRAERVKEKLQKAHNWLIEKWGQTGIDTVGTIATGTDTAPVYYNLQGARIQSPAKGQIVVEVRDGKATKIAF